MNPAIESLNRLAAAWAGLAWAVAWQSTLLVGLCAIVAHSLRRSSPALRYWLWQIAAIKLLAMPLCCVPIALPALPHRHADDPTGERPTGRVGVEIDALRTERAWMLAPGATADGPTPGTHGGWAPSVPVDWRGWLFLGWGLIVAGQVAAIARQRTLLTRLLHRASPAVDPALLALVAELSERIGLRRRPEVLIADGEVSPFVCGLRRPVLVMPGGLARSLDVESLRSVLLHELAHLKRRDLLWDWIPACARLFYFFHPAAHYVAYRVRLERELACDQAAMVLAGRGAAGYASTLVAVVSRSSAPPALRSALASAHLDGAEPFPISTSAIDATASRFSQ